MTRQTLSRQNGLVGIVATVLGLVAMSIILGLLLLQSPFPVSAASVNGFSSNTDNSASSDQAPAAGHVRRVNMPYFSGGIPFGETAIFWLGQVGPNTQYGDIRMGYNNGEILINANVMDSLLWYNENTPSAGNLTQYDSISIFLSKNNTGVTAPNGSSYRFDTGFTWYESNRSKWQYAYQGNGTGWTRTGLGFSTDSTWRGDRPNNSNLDRGWRVTLHIPFTSLGLSGPPSNGTLWRLGVILHNRNNAAGNVMNNQVWPEGMSKTNVGTWGQLRFGLAPGYSAPATRNLKTIPIRNRYNGQVATTTNVGGYTQCGQNLGNFGLIYYQRWGIQNWANMDFLNVMNQDDVADWACYNKVYAMFPLGTIPAGKVITSARLTIYQFGHAGDSGQNPGPSLIQLFSTDTSWAPNTINWNNAPKPNENLDRQWAGTGSCPTYRNCPSVTWDVSRQVANAYKTGQPLRVILYDSDDQISSGKYFFSSEQGDWNAANRPILRVTYGDP